MSWTAVGWRWSGKVNFFIACCWHLHIKRLLSHRHGSKVWTLELDPKSTILLLYLPCAMFKLALTFSTNCLAILPFASFLSYVLCLTGQMVNSEMIKLEQESMWPSLSASWNVYLTIFSFALGFPLPHSCLLFLQAALTFYVLAKMVLWFGQRLSMNWVVRKHLLLPTSPPPSVLLNPPLLLQGRDNWMFLSADGSTINVHTFHILSKRLDPPH